MKPAFAEGHNNHGTALVRKGQTDEAIRLDSQRAGPQKPRHYPCQRGANQQGNLPYQEALRLNSGDAIAGKNLDAALSLKKKPEESSCSLRNPDFQTNTVSNHRVIFQHTQGQNPDSLGREKRRRELLVGDQH